MSIYSIGIDIGSTTVKVVVLENNRMVFMRYERHLSQVRDKALEMLKDVLPVVGDSEFTVAISGSAGLGVAKDAGLEFVQEVFATGGVVEKWLPGTDIVIELGGEDAKILFVTGGMEERMNGTCAGGTGAFIDQMATLLDVTPDELDTLAAGAKRIYPIASRCGVFAKSDIQPLLNEGADKRDVALSIFQAVVDQTVTGLAQGRKLIGRIAFLGGPLHFFKALRERFVKTLELSEEDALFPDWAQYSVAAGAALYAAESGTRTDYDGLIKALSQKPSTTAFGTALKPLFESQAQYDEFKARHQRATVESADIDSYEGDAFLGVDCGSTTVKLVLISEDLKILWRFYGPNSARPLDIIKDELLKLYDRCSGRIKIRSSAVTGYGEALMKSAFHFDHGVVETMAHFKATRFFKPDVDFILDIGGQDIKCFKIKNGAIDSIMLNEACSSGCGSFIETFAKSMGYTAEEFAKLGLFAEHPMDLGSRCTVFMNSSVKQAQKDGATVGDISAGLCVSVVKNAIYKVIRARGASELGENIVVQGGTFYNDAVLRSFEREIGMNVTRPTVAGLMGAFGAALYAKENMPQKSGILDKEQLERFSYTVKPARCGRCANNCRLTVVSFEGGGRHISGNKCSKPLGKGGGENLPNLYEFKRQYLASLKAPQSARGKVGLPMALNMFENLPFWWEFFVSLGYQPVISGRSDDELYRSGCATIPSDTVCYPAKLVHGHLMRLVKDGVDTIFYPAMTYNMSEVKGVNHYNCPVVAYYPELAYANIEALSKVRFLYPYLDISDKKRFIKKSAEFFKKEFGAGIKELRAAAEAGYNALWQYRKAVKSECERAISYAREHSLMMAVLAGRPYHIDEQINHGIDKMLSSLGLVVLSEDGVADNVPDPKVEVLNQWTYHSRLYRAAQYCVENDDIQLIQLVSFGCGIDAITTDEVRRILEEGDKLYTQLKIDEVDNLGAIRIRVRSLLGALSDKQKLKERAYAHS